MKQNKWILDPATTDSIENLKTLILTNECPPAVFYVNDRNEILSGMPGHFGMTSEVF